ncbi:MAG TPA: outer membrane beta-barrel protein [Chthonomonadaceae bacterium]|nr:outer membrane beta-barrel protein [Chthonomonadaceae bacterium]
MTVCHVSPHASRRLPAWIPGFFWMLAVSLLLGAALRAQAQQSSSPAPATGTPAAQTPAQPPTPAAPPAPSGPAPGAYSVSGLLDVYYEYNARNPAKTYLVTPDGESIPIQNNGRAFDVIDGTPVFSLGELNIQRTQGKGLPFGITGTFTAGDTARIVHSTEYGGTRRWQWLQQLYLTRATPIKTGSLNVDFGVFVTPYGYEVIESSSNDNYSRGLLFTYAIPFYHAGLRITAPVTRSITLLAGVVNGWNDIADDNDSKSIITQITWAPSPKYTAIVGYMGGNEGTGAYGSAIPKNAAIATDLLDAQVVTNPTSRLKLVAWADYGHGSGNVDDTHVSGSWVGLAAFARYQITTPIAAALRIEQLEDIPGAGPRPGGLRFGIGYLKLREITLTLEYAHKGGHLLSRLEYRHDDATSPFFNSHGSLVTYQDTFTLGEVYKF